MTENEAVAPTFLELDGARLFEPVVLVIAPAGVQLARVGRSPVRRRGRG